MSIFSKLFHSKEQPEERKIADMAGDGLYEEGEPEESTSTEEEGQEDPGSVEDPDIVYEVVEREILPAKIICPDCGGITLEGLDFCDKCGGELQ